MLRHSQLKLPRVQCHHLFSVPRQGCVALGDGGFDACEKIRRRSLHLPARQLARGGRGRSGRGARLDASTGRSRRSAVEGAACNSTRARLRLVLWLRVMRVGAPATTTCGPQPQHARSCNGRGILLQLRQRRLQGRNRLFRCRSSA
jgi:hypothetical protein